MNSIIAVVTLIFKIFNLFKKNKPKPAQKPPVKEKPAPVVVEEVKPEPIKEEPKKPMLSDKLNEAKDVDELLELMIENEEDEMMREVMSKLRKTETVAQPQVKIELEDAPKKRGRKPKGSDDVKLTE